MSTESKIVSLVTVLEAQDAEQREYSAHMGRIRTAQGILADALRTMRDEGIDEAEIIGVLRHAANELSA
jgi:hypothetical protein